MINLDSAIINICNNEYNYFLSKNNVQGVGLAYKVTNSHITNKKCICVMVSKKLSKNLLTSNDLIPKFYKSIETDVIEIGEIITTSLTQRIRPVIGGYCIGPAGTYSTGCYGGLVKDANDLYVISNNHVIALENLIPIGNPILQPSPEYGGVSPQDKIAILDRFVPLNPITPISTPENFVDCAIAKVIDSTLVSSYISFIGIPKGITSPKLGMNVQMACSTSTFIFSQINAINSTITVNTPLKNQYLFKNQIAINHGGKPGDSGAFVLTLNRNVVGLLLGGTNNILFANPIDIVLQSLNVSLITT